MAQPFCDPFTACDGLDGRLLISAAIQGPPLAWDLGEVSFGAFTSTGVAARPYVDVHLKQSWTPKEACYAPIRSIFSLAPGETVQIAASVRHQFSFAHAVSSASSDSRSTQGPVRSGSADDIVSKKMKEQALVEQKMRYAGGYGSFWEVVANIIAPGVGGAIVNAAEGVAKHADEAAKDAIKDAMANAHQAVETIARSESQHSSTGSTTTSETTETVQSITRTFSNPYRDRSLQLRFIPVFRHFEVRTWPASVTPGIALHVGAARAVNQATLRVRDVLAQAPTQVDAAVLQQPLARLLSSSQEARVQTKTSAAGGAAPSPGAAGALLWSQSIVREDSVLVPLAEPDTAASAFGLKGQSRAGFLKTLDKIRPEVVGKLFPVNVQHVHLFMGTHVEAVAGECILQDLPPLPAPD